MTRLRILSDTPLDAAALRLLRGGTAGHDLVVRDTTTSVLSASGGSLDGFDVVFGQPDPAAVLAASTLRWVQVTSAGYTRYDTPEFRTAARTRSLVLTNSSAVYAEPCAEHVLAFMLAQARLLPASLRTRSEAGTPEWNAVRRGSRLLVGQTVLLLGYGAIARALVRMLAPFEMRVTAFRRQRRGDEGVAVVDEAGLADALADADHVVNLLPASADTHRFMTAGRLGGMKPGAVFYNVGRGTTVDQTALADALRSKRLAAAWLDVTDPEPLPRRHPLLGIESCHITPHVAGGRHDEWEALVRHFVANVVCFVAGTPLADRVL